MGRKNQNHRDTAKGVDKAKVPEHLKYINVLYTFKKQNQILLYTHQHTLLTIFHMNRVQCNTVVRWHFEIYFSVCNPHPHPHLQLVCFTVLRFRIDSSLFRLRRMVWKRILCHRILLLKMACWHVGESCGDGRQGFTPQWKRQCQLNITFNFLVLWSPGY